MRNKTGCVHVLGKPFITAGTCCFSVVGTAFLLTCDLKTRPRSTVQACDAGVLFPGAHSSPPVTSLALSLMPRCPAPSPLDPVLSFRKLTRLPGRVLVHLPPERSKKQPPAGREARPPSRPQDAHFRVLRGVGLFSGLCSQVSLESRSRCTRPVRRAGPSRNVGSNGNFNVDPAERK